LYQGQIRTFVAAITLGGHVLVFAAGMGLGLFGPLQGSDLVQVVLMASPVLAATATSALKFVLAGQTSIDQGERVTTIFACVVIAFPVLLISGIFVLFWSIYKQVSGFGPNELKVGLGALETFFGAYLGLIAATLFGSSNP